MELETNECPFEGISGNNKEIPSNSRGMSDDEAINILTHWADGLWIDEHGITNGDFDIAVDIACKALNPSNSCNSDKNLQELDAEYLQSKIDAFTEARRKDGKTADEMLDACRGGALELTWQEVKRLWEVGMDVADYNSYHNIQIEDEAFYKEVLKRYQDQDQKTERNERD